MLEVPSARWRQVRVFSSGERETRKRGPERVVENRGAVQHFFLTQSFSQSDPKAGS